MQINRGCGGGGCFPRTQRKPEPGNIGKEGHSLFQGDFLLEILKVQLKMEIEVSLF